MRKSEYSRVHDKLSQRCQWNSTLTSRKIHFLLPTCLVRRNFTLLARSSHPRAEKRYTVCEGEKFSREQFEKCMTCHESEPSESLDFIINGVCSSGEGTTTMAKTTHNAWKNYAKKKWCCGSLLLGAFGNVTGGLSLMLSVVW